MLFDEAQRAWNRDKTARFMKARKGIPGFSHSESEFLISYLDRHEGWAVIVCLVGGGQEIHDGEAGIGAWLDAVREQFPRWRAYVSTELHDREYAAEANLGALAGSGQLRSDGRLHLSTSMRSFRSEKLSGFVKALLDSDVAAARDLHREISATYPIVVTRDLDQAKEWIRSQARGSEPYGLLASPRGMRLKPHAIDAG